MCIQHITFLVARMVFLSDLTSVFNLLLLYYSSGMVLPCMVQSLEVMLSNCKRRFAV